MKRVIFTVFSAFLTLLAISGVTPLKAQCNLSPVLLSERIQKSSVVIEGMVQSSESLWDDKHYNIYTIYKVEVLSSFKGNSDDSVYYVLTRGGIVGDRMDVVSNELELLPGKTGVFTLIPTTKPVTKSYPLYEAYAAIQGFVGYDKHSRKPQGIFENFSGVDALYQKAKSCPGIQHRRRKNIVWKDVVQHDGHQHHNHRHSGEELHVEENEGLHQDELYAEESAAAVASGATISSFSPTTVQAGIGTQLTINGSGFGASQGTSYVEFLNTNTGGASYTTPYAHQYISWSDTKIEVEVPSYAGTGKFRVSDGTNTVQSSTNLTVEYAISNLTYSSKYYRANLISDNGSGGYAFQMYTTFDANSNAKTDFTNVVNQWVCATGVNWSFGTTTTTDATASDNLNVVRFDSGSELSAGVLGLATSRYNGCTSGSSYAWYLSEIDVQVDDGTNFFYGSSGSPSGSQYDFYTVMLHEMGHAHQLGHVIDNTKLMHYSISAGTQKRTISTAELTGATYEMTQSTAGSTCSQSAHIDYSCNPSVTLSTAASTIAETSGSTTVTATLSKRSFSAVTVSLSLSGTATVTSDYTLSTSITIPAGSLSASITLSSVSDTKYEGNETVIVAISSVTNGTESGTQQSTVTITDDDSAPTVTLSTGASSISEAAATTTVTATLSAVSGLATTITLSLSGTATVTSDYTLSTTITIPAGSTSASNTLTAVNDVVYEGSETVIIDISAVTNGTESGTQQSTVTITDNETAPTVTLTTGATSISEAAATTTVTATLSASSGVATTVTLLLSGTATVTSDYTLSTTITIPAGSTSASNTLTAVNDVLYEGNETVIIDISSVTNGTESGTQQRTVTITDNETAPTVTLTSGATSIAETSGSTTVTATLSAASGLATTVTLSLTGTATVASDYTLSTTITIPAGSTSASNTLSSVSDALYEGSETVIVDISAVTNGTESGTQQRTVSITDDETAPTVTLTTGTSSLAETSGSTTVTATISATSGLATTVTLSLSGTATVTSDYTLATTITIPAGSTSASNTLSSVSDALYEGSETVIVDISSVTNGTESGTQQRTVTITDDESAPTVTLTAGATSISETSGSTTLTATLSAASGLATTVTLSLSGTATVTSDYTLSSTITIPAGSTSASNTLSSVNDVLYEGSETVIVDISAVTNGTESGTQQRTVSITDDDTQPTVTIAWSNSSIGEGPAGTSNAVATLSAASGVATTITLDFTNTATLNSDYTLTATSIVIPAGSISGYVTMNNITDNLYEGNEYITVEISSVSNATESGSQWATMTINDDDTAPTVTLSYDNASISESGGIAAITATLSAVSGLATTASISVSGTATIASDYTLSTTITIPAGSSSASITLSAVNDATYEGDETVIVDIATVTNGSESGTQQITVTLTEDDAAPFVTLSAGTASISENGGSTVLTATLSATSGVSTTITFGTSGTASAADYSLSSTLVIPAGSISGSVTLTGLDDATDEYDETATVAITAVTNGTENGEQEVTITLTDDDDEPTVVLSVSTSTASENGGTGNFIATLSSISGKDVTVQVSFLSDAVLNTDYSVAATSILIPAGSISGTIQLTALNDNVYEGNENAEIALSSVSNATPAMGSAQWITITDDEVIPIVTFVGNTTSMPEDGGTATFTATLSGLCDEDIRIYYALSGTASSGTDYDANALAAFTIPAGSLSASVTVLSIDDATEESDETLVLEFNDVDIADYVAFSQTVTIIDDEKPEVAISINSNTVNSGGSYDFGNVAVGTSTTVTVTIENTGTGTLSLTDSPVAILSGTDADKFSLDLSGTSATLAVGASTSFTLTFDSDCGDERQATLSIANNDEDEAVYSISISAIPSDQTAPTPNLSSLTTVTGICNATVTVPTATDGCDGTITATTNDPVSYSAEGTYEITWTYTDLSGNVSTQTQDVIISGDHTAPVLTCPSDIIATEQTVTYAEPAVSDNCDALVSPVLQSGLASGSIFPAGITTITYSATDANGNTTTCSFTVTVTLTSTEAADFAQHVSMYPVPCSDQLNLENLGTLDAINVFNSNGTIMYSSNSVSGHLELEVSAWAAGIYFIRFEKDGAFSSKKFEVMK